MTTKLNGTIKAVAGGVGLAATIAILGLMFGMVRATSVQVENFRDKYDERLRRVETLAEKILVKAGSIEGRLDRIDKRIERLEAHYGHRDAWPRREGQTEPVCDLVLPSHSERAQGQGVRAVIP